MPVAPIQPYFAVPVASVLLAHGNELNDALRARLLEWERDEGVRTSVPTEVPKHAVYESDFSLFYRKDALIAELARLCLGTLGDLIMRINGYSAAEMQNLRIYHHSWYHITRYGGYTSGHNHPMASWSGVYCVAPGEELSDRPDSGVLRLYDPRVNSLMYLDPGNAHFGPPYGAGSLPMRLRPGELVLFPSYLRHEVAPFWGRDDRITVAFNAWVREAGQA
ncbi:MAG TPA: putative 2OG-Fe(II) oxygenase, partial [Gammaproteobacteria bacterium]|nr:putative 2OG-Fe(II) oxygenase [Gammaproteobacteria bacterium]